MKSIKIGALAIIASACSFSASAQTKEIKKEAKVSIEEPAKLETKQLKAAEKQNAKAYEKRKKELKAALFEEVADQTGKLFDPNVLTIDRLQFLGSIKRVSIFANKTTHQIKLKLAGSELSLSAEDIDFANEANERLTCEHEGEDIEIGFNAKFLIEMLTNADSDQVEMHLSAPNRAGLIFPVDQDSDENLLMLVMPVMLNNYV